LKIDKDEVNEIQKCFLSIYYFINNKYPEKQLTARNLQMMIMRYAITKNPFLSAFNEVSGVLNKEERNGLALFIKISFNQDIKALKKMAKQELSQDSLTQSFLITKKRTNPLNILQTLTKIRESKIQNPKSLGSVGTNGLIIEGNPGTGKSSLAIEYLHSKGLPYYHIQAGELEEIKQTLINAFHEGSFVIIDEMNTMPLETLLNSLLSSTTPEGQSAEKPGFFVIGTQNPIQYGHRSAYSKAFLNRFQKLDLKDYAEEDLKIITTSMTNDSDKTKKLVDYFLEAQAYAKQNRKLIPSPRDLFEKAKDIKK
jgi:adenylate kinase family enzyme